MRPLFTLSARWVLLCCCLVFSVALLAALVRLLPWVVARDVPLATTLVFAQILAARGAEVAGLIGFPVGAAIAAALFVERGEARALAALGVRPLRLAAGLVPLAATAVILSIAVAESAESSAAERFAAKLVGSGRGVCASTGPPRRVDVPLLSMSWLCLATGPRLVGAVPGLHAGLWFSGADVRAAAGERALIIDDLHMAAPGAGLSLHAATARISGLPAGAGARGVAGGWRGLLTGLIATGTGLSSAWAVLRGNVEWPTWAAAASGAAALVTVALVRVLDRDQAGAAIHGLLVPAGALVALLLHAAVRLFSSSHIAGRKA